MRDIASAHNLIFSMVNPRHQPLIEPWASRPIMGVAELDFHIWRGLALDSPSTNTTATAGAICPSFEVKLRCIFDRGNKHVPGWQKALLCKRPVNHVGDPQRAGNYKRSRACSPAFLKPCLQNLLCKLLCVLGSDHPHRHSASNDLARFMDSR